MKRACNGFFALGLSIVFLDGGAASAQAPEAEPPTAPSPADTSQSGPPATPEALQPALSPNPAQTASTLPAGSPGPTLDLPPPPTPVPAPLAAVAPAPSPQVAPEPEHGTSIGGYAEMVYNLAHVTGPGSTQAGIDLRRMVLFVGHRFDDKLRFYSEIEVEHAVASPDRTGEVEIEQAYLDYLLLGNALGLRAGVILVPMGIINQWHEPPVFHGVERPAVDTVIIPSTWREGGLGAFGEPIEGLRYQLYVMGGLNPSGFSAAQGIREGRQEVAEARADGLAVSGRVEVEPLLGLVAGLSGYFGPAGANADLYDRARAKLKLDVPVWGMSADARIRRGGLEARAVFAMFGVGDTARLRQAFDADGKSLGLDIGARLFGVYGELAYDVLRPLVVSDQQLLPFVRLERYDTMASVRGRATTAADEAFAVTDLVAGLSYRPLRQVAFKGDFLLRMPDRPGQRTGQLDLGVGVMF